MLVTPWLVAVLLVPQAPSAAPAPAQETPAQEFRRLGEELYAGDCPIMGTALRRSLMQELQQPDLKPRQRIQASLQLGQELTEAGQVERAIETLEQALEFASHEGRENALGPLHRQLAIAYLRQAENVNCVERRNGDCCVLPLREGALHAVREPALEAREHYAAVLAITPDDLQVRWVYNLLTLLLAEPLEGLPAEQRLPLGAFGSGGSDVLPTFRDVGQRAGAATLNLAGGVAVEDFDGDGLLDIVSSNCDVLGPMTYLRNQGDGTFENQSQASHIDEQLGGLNMISADYDNDGDQDPLVLRGAWLLDYGRMRKSLLRNDAGAKSREFVDVTRAAGLAEPAAPTQAGVFADFDSDGWLDLYVGCESRVEIDQGKGSYLSQLYRSNGDGTFREIGAEAGVQNDRYAKGACVGDYDDDGDIDLYVSNIGVNRLYRNDGRSRFEDVALTAKVGDPAGRSFACWFFDYDNDGGLDLWVGAYSTKVADLACEALGKVVQSGLPCLYKNQRDGTFKDMARELGLARPFAPMGANFGDVDHDGWLDIYLGTGDPELESLMPNVLLQNLGARRFVDRTAASGLGQLQKGHGVAFADLDHDGDEDLYHVLGGFVPVDRYQNALFENLQPNGHWLYLELEGTRTNREATGARVKVVVETPDGPREVHRAAGSVSSFGGSPHRLEIGLGDAARIARLEIRWPRTAELQVFEDVPLDACLRVREGSAAFERVELKSFRF